VLAGPIDESVQFGRLMEKLPLSPHRFSPKYSPHLLPAKISNDARVIDLWHFHQISGEESVRESNGANEVRSLS
jgi:hypothetical protein